MINNFAVRDSELISTTTKCSGNNKITTLDSNAEAKTKGFFFFSLVRVQMQLNICSTFMSNYLIKIILDTTPKVQ